MTPYRDRRQDGFYHPEGETPDETHSHHLLGLGTAMPPPDEPEPEPEDEPSPDQETNDLDSLTKADWLDRARELGISPANAAMSKGELRAAVESHS